MVDVCQPSQKELPESGQLSFATRRMDITAPGLRCRSEYGTSSAAAQTKAFLSRLKAVISLTGRKTKKLDSLSKSICHRTAGSFVNDSVQGRAGI